MDVSFSIDFRNRRKQEASFGNHPLCDTQDYASGKNIRIPKNLSGHHYQDIRKSDISTPQQYLHANNSQDSPPIDTENRLCDLSTFRSSPRNYMNQDQVAPRI